MFSEKEKTGGSGYKIAAIALAVLLVVVLAASYTSYFNLQSSYLQLKSEYSQTQEKYLKLQEEHSSLKNDYTNLSSKYNELEGEHSKLLEDYEDLQNKHSKLLEDYKNLGLEFKTLQNRLREKEEEYISIVNEYSRLRDGYNTLESKYTLLLGNLTLIGINVGNIDELWKLKETMITRTYLIYNYEREIWEWYFWHWLPIEWYLYERTKIIHEPMTLEDRVVKYSEALVREYIYHPLINKVADFLWEASEGDVEKFVNYVLELVHQLPYNETYYAKSPIETFIEGTGDCDNLAILAATIIENKGLDAVLIYGIACDGIKCGGHAMIGVALPNLPDDLFRFGRESYWYIEHEGKRYYIAETTPIGGDVANFDNPEHIGFFVGDNPWDIFEIEHIVDV